MLRLLIAEGDKATSEFIKYHVCQNLNEIELLHILHDGEDALKAINSLKPDIIICDIALSRLSGLELLRVLHERSYSGEVIVLSKEKDFYSIEKSMDYGAVAFLLKPLNENKLIEKIKLAAKRLLLRRKTEELERLSRLEFANTHLGRKKLVIDALKLVADYYNTPLTIKYVAERLFISQSHLMHIFKQDMGKTFNRYLIDYRLEVAKKLMDKNCYKIYEVAAMAGFSDAKYFGQVFKRYVGVMPSEYKR